MQHQALVTDSTSLFISGTSTDGIPFGNFLTNVNTSFLPWVDNA